MRSNRHSNTLKKRYSKIILKPKQYGGNLICSLKGLESKCGNEGCVYFTEDTATKMLIDTIDRLIFLQERCDMQKKAANLGLAPELLNFKFIPITKINIKGKDAPCYVKRGLTLRGKKVISYVLQTQKSWCRGYNKRSKSYPGYVLSDDTTIEIPENLFEVMKKLHGKYKVLVKNQSINFPNIINNSTYEYNSDKPISNNVPYSNNELSADSNFSTINTDTIHTKFIEQFNLFFIKIVSERIRGITINELYEYLVSKRKTIDDIGPLWNKEIEYIRNLLRDEGIKVQDINENNVMIDVQNENVCSFIMENIDKNIPITPTLIREKYKGFKSILKVVDWGM